MFSIKSVLCYSSLEHMASTKQCQWTPFLAAAVTSPCLSHCFGFLLCCSSPAPSRSSSPTLSFGVPTQNLFFCFRGILPQCASISLAFPQFNALLLVRLICASTLGQTILHIFLKHLFINVWRSLVIVCVMLQFKDWHSSKWK
jgi:hypothetical protein